MILPRSNPAVRDDRFDLENRGLLVAEGEPGLCRVICFSPRHDLTLATMPSKDIENVIRTWTAQFRELGQCRKSITCRSSRIAAP